MARSTSLSQAKGPDGASATSNGVVISGGTSGLGYCLAREFLQLGDRVVICGRNEDRVQEALKELQRHTDGGHSVFGMACDVGNAEQVQAFADFAQARLGTVTHWINNAGLVTRLKPLHEVDPDELRRVTEANLLGPLLCCRAAVRLMANQEPMPDTESGLPSFHIFNLGFSSWGVLFSKSAATHKATKVGLSQLTRSLNEELQAATKAAASEGGSLFSADGLGNIAVHQLSPGLVLTDLLLKDASPVAKRFFNVLAEEPETVARELAPRIRKVASRGESVEFLSFTDALYRVLSGVATIIMGNGRFFNSAGERIQNGAEEFNENGVRILYPAQKVSE